MNDTKSTENEERCLIDLAAQGNADAVRAIVEQHQAMVYGTCLRILKNEADAKDAAQATFIVFLKKCNTLKRGTVLGGWLYNTAGFVSREFIRASIRRQHREKEAEVMTELSIEKAGEIWKELEPELDAAVMALPDKYRDVVVLRYLEGRSTSEAAGILGVSVSSVTTSLARALDKLRGCFQRKGIILSAAILATVLAENAAASVVPTTIGSSILTAAQGAAAGGIVTAVSVKINHIIKGVLMKMFWTKGKVAALFAVLAGSVIGVHAVLTPAQIDALNFTKQQTEQANTVLQTYRAEYLAIEKKHTTFQRDETNLVQLTITAFPDELKELKTRFWKNFDKVCITELQREVARQRISVKDLFSYGDCTRNIELSFDGRDYHHSDAYIDPRVGVQLGGSETGSNLSPEYKRFWGDRDDGMSFRLSDLLSMGARSGGSVDEPKEKPLDFTDGVFVLSDNFIRTLDINQQKVILANQVLKNVFGQYLVIEKKHTGTVTEAPDGSKCIEITSFRSERDKIIAELWNELDKVLDQRQMRIAKDSISMALGSDLFTYGDKNCSVRIKPENDGSTTADVKFPGGHISSSGIKLPDKYSRLRSSIRQ